jgi:hypothetical protein
MTLRIRERQVRKIGGGRARICRVCGPAWLGMLALGLAEK